MTRGGYEEAWKSDEVQWKNVCVTGSSRWYPNHSESGVSGDLPDAH